MLDQAVIDRLPKEAVELAQIAVQLDRLLPDGWVARIIGDRILIERDGF